MKFLNLFFKRGRKNNQGSTLVMVIFCMLLFSTIGITLLSTTAINLKMKRVSNNSTSNFYATEQGLDQFVIILQTKATDILRQTYADLIKEYAGVESGKRKEHLEDEFAIKLEDYLKTDGEIEAIAANAGITINSIPAVVRENKNVLIKGISITYLDSDGYETTITTDLCLYTNAGEAVAASGTTVSNLKDYVVISDKQLANSDNASAVRTIKGNIYTGEGILIDKPSTEFKINADYIISRGDITVDNLAKLTIAGMTTQCEVWINNFELNNSNKSTQTNAVGDVVNYDELVVDAKCYVADDLTFNSDYANAVFKGEYSGYSISNASETADGSSSITINSHNISLDMSEAELILAGNTYISVPNVYGGSTAATVSNSFAEGDSLTYKAGQTAYLVPGECIPGVGHNPMTEAEFNSFKNTSPNWYAYMLDDTTTLANYAVGYKSVVVQYGSNSNMVYLYIEFASKEKAAEFYQKYYVKNPELVKSHISLMGGETNIKLNSDDKVTTIGNIVTYNAVTGVSLKPADATTVAMTNVMAGSRNTYVALINGLTKGNVYTPASYLTKNIVDYTYLASVVDPSTNKKEVNSNIDDAYVLLSKEDISLNSTINGKTCFIVCDGNVTLDNCNFRGLIICSGDVTITGTTTSASYADVAGGTTIDDIINACVVADPDFAKLFYGLSGGDTPGSVSDTADPVIIEYENWHKN